MVPVSKNDVMQSRLTSNLHQNSRTKAKVFAGTTPKHVSPTQARFRI